MTAAYIQVPFRLDLFMETNNMDPNQTAPSVALREQSDQCSYCLQYRLPKNITRRSNNKNCDLREKV